MHVTVLTLMYAGCLRFSDAQNIGVESVRMMFCADYVNIFLPTSKTDQEMVGTWVPIPVVGGPYCPVALLARLLLAGGYRLDPSFPDEDVGPLLRAVISVPGGQRLKQVVGTRSAPIMSLVHSTFLASCKAMCAKVGIKKAITLHSFRIGAATEAANAGVDGRLVRDMGRWKSDSTVQVYTRQSLSALLHARRAVGLLSV